ncbi:MAG TPA: tetratricopeptide repeat-containing protein [Gemmataceae bacterium]|nr:tetratricopeptide repeat-containing protein [Gemmataceae bacterium]
MSEADDDLLAQLDAAVRDYRNDTFCLCTDLKHLDRVRRVQAPEAMVLYCGRILEVLSGGALVAIGLAPSQPFANLSDLERMNLIPQVTLFLAHGLRRVANSARHVNYPLTPHEADVVLIYLERWLHWYFCSYKFGPRRTTLALGSDSLHLSPEAELRQFVIQLEAPDLDKAKLQSLVESDGKIWQHSSSVAAILAEVLIESGEYPLATTVLDSALQTFPNELRLTQLQALWFSRNKKPEEAVRLLKDSAEDEETLGILGGALKRLWDRDQKRTYLEQCYNTYRKGWERSKGTSVYLGINAATTAFWLKRPQKVIDIARQIAELLEKREAAIAALHGEIRLGFWDEVTLAEARLLLGELAAARKTYDAAFTHHPEKVENIKIAKEQAEKILVEQGQSIEEAASFFAGSPPQTAMAHPAL